MIFMKHAIAENRKLPQFYVHINMYTKDHIVGRSTKKLTVKEIDRLPAGTHGDGGGLWLRKNSPTSAQWLYRFRLHGRTRQMGLGSYPVVSLANARKFRDRCAEQVAQRKDPVAERRRERDTAQTQLVSLAEVAESAFEARKAELKDEGKAGRWFGPLKLHVLPKIGNVPAVDVTQLHIRDAVSQIWKSKADTARKAMNRLNITLKHAAALGLDVDLLAVEKAKALLGKQDHKTKNIPAMPWREVPAFYAGLVDDTPTQLALKLLILNPGPRSKPIRFLRIEHIADDVWTVPGELMKGLKGKVEDWRTPLSHQSRELIEKARRWERNGYFFPNISGRGVISDATMSRHMERSGLEYRPHGFRSSFRTWAAETGNRRDVAELCNAHKIFGAVEAAYIRTDFLDERRALLQEWSDFVSKVSSNS